MDKIDCFIAYHGQEETANLMGQLKQQEEVGNIFILCNSQTHFTGATCLVADGLYSTKTLKTIASNTTANYTLFLFQGKRVTLGQFALHKLLQVARNTKTSMVYADYYEDTNGLLQPHPTIDYQQGSLRDDFDFGPALLFRTSVLKTFKGHDFDYAGLYALRLWASRQGEVIRIPEFLFTCQEVDKRQSGEKQFDYVKAEGRKIQVEMEQACTHHLKEIGAFLKPGFRKVAFDNHNFPVEASVLIPVKNRVNTIQDAVGSVLKQQTTFPFNLLVVDNHSTDGTTELLKEYAQQKKLIHIVPERKDLGIGGCWNEGIFHPACGKFVVQLDSDDLYADETTLQAIVDTFYAEDCAMVIGSYQITNFDLEEIPPGVITHAEWTPENGANNALRINGLGAPRAFYTPIIREVKFPNVSYGEDYAVALTITRKYTIGRIYKPIYLCRRWEGNTDAALDIEKQNKHNWYKDHIRTIELHSRMRS